MIYRVVDPDTVYVDRATLTTSLHRPLRTIRDHCAPLACDVRTRALLYDAASCLAALDNVPTVKPTRRQVA